VSTSISVVERSLRVETAESPRHSAVVRVTHWINTLSFIGLLVSGIAVLISHPRFYWGEVGNVETASLFDLPLPKVLAGQNGWGRYLHFLSAWVCVLNGSFYALSGLLSRHFKKSLLPLRADLAWSSLRQVIASHLRLEPPRAERSYNVLQRLAYSVVVFLFFPLAVWTGLAMSPAITSVTPIIVTVWGGHQSARTLHFFVAVALVLFLIVHIVMVSLTGFRKRMRAMITGHTATLEENE
jgi:thiosulfate reductase cytochrome b subunit